MCPGGLTQRYVAMHAFTVTNGSSAEWGRGVCNQADSAANDPVNFSAVNTLLGLGRQK